MNLEYLNIYNNLIKLTRNKSLYIKLSINETFSDRIMFFFFHFAFFLKAFKSEKSKKKLQKIYDFNFKQIEISLREIGYGDQSINKKMKIYINIFHSIIDKINDWENLSYFQKSSIFKNYLNESVNIEFFNEYFDKYRVFLLKNTLNYFTKDIKVLKF